MDNKELIKEMVKLQVLYVRWVERNTDLRCHSFGDLDVILKGKKFTITYKEAVENLKTNIEKYCENDYLLKSVLQLKKNIYESELSNLRFGYEPQKKFTDLEYSLNIEVLQRTIFMLNGMVEIKHIVENLGIKESTIKQACQQERLLNTKKLGRTWMVHIPECRSYWDIPNTDTKGWNYSSN